MAEIIVPNTLAYMVAIRKLFDEGKVSLEQYAECLRRYSEIIKR